MASIEVKFKQLEQILTRLDALTRKVDTLMTQVQELQDAIQVLIASDEEEAALIQQVIDRLNEADEDFTDEIAALTTFTTERATRTAALRTAFEADAAGGTPDAEPPVPGGGEPV